MAEDQGTSPDDGREDLEPAAIPEPREAAGTEPDAEALTPEETAEVQARTSSRWSESDRARERELLATLASSEPGSPQHAAARDALVTLHLPLVQFLARRFRDRGEPLEDLVQVGTIGLIKAVDRFDPERGVEFSTYATPTIVGEIKRHFRDKGWAIRVPRHLQELRLALTKATEELTHEMLRAPTVHELAAHLSISDDEVLQGLECGRAYNTQSIDPLLDPDDDDVPLAAIVGSVDPALERAEDRHALRPLMEKLPERERRMIEMRFFGNMTQTEIAEQLGISQMHVSRLLTRTLAGLREQLLRVD